MRKVLIVDTSILCVWLAVPSMETCGPDNDKWDKKRVDELIAAEIEAKTTLVLPLATIIETGNHIAHIGDNRRFKLAQELSRLIEKAADAESPWAAFTEQSHLWGPEGLRELAAEWPALAATGLSIGDMTIKTIADYYAEAFEVEILTGDADLKAYQPVTPAPVPRRRR